MARLLLVLGFLLGFSASGGLHAQGDCVADGCGCPHEAPSPSCCCAEVTREAPPARAPERAALLEELRQGRLDRGPCLVNGGCRGARRSRAQVNSSTPAGLPAAHAEGFESSSSGAPSTRPSTQPEPRGPEPAIPPPRTTAVT